jgi:hypothetical protein
VASVSALSEVAQKPELCLQVRAAAARRDAPATEEPGVLAAEASFRAAAMLECSSAAAD